MKVFSLFMGKRIAVYTLKDMRCPVYPANGEVLKAANLRHKVPYCGVISCTVYQIRSQDSVVGIATGLLAGRSRGQSSSPGMVKNFQFSISSRPTLGPSQPPNQCAPGDLSLWVKRPGREADHSPPASAEVKKIWIYTSTLPHAFMAYGFIS
jgi:hypothetical protein